MASDERGQSLVELAGALPLLLFILLGLVDITRVYAFKIAATSAAREGALYASRNSQATADLICVRAISELANGAPVACVLDPVTDPGHEIWRSAIPSATVVCTRGAIPTPPPCGHELGPLLYQREAGAAVSVTVTYEVTLITTALLERVFSDPHVRIGATAVIGGLGQ